MRTPVLKLDAIDKVFPGTRALTNVSFEAFAGEVHALVGENGAGKSTIVGLVAGELAPDGGQLWVGEQLLERPNPALVRSLGVAIVHQHPQLMPDLSVAENLYLGVPNAARPRLRGAAAWADALLGKWRADCAGIRVRERVEVLSPYQRFVVEFVMALAENPKVLVLDEPTGHLGIDDRARLFEIIRKMRTRNVAIVYISHRLSEVKEIANRITVLREGVIQKSAAAADMSEEEIVRLITGRVIDAEFPPKGTMQCDTSGISRRIYDSAINGTALTVNAGEIVGIGGIEGNGQRELIRALGGARGTRRRRLGAGYSTNSIAFLSEDRENEGILPGLAVRENFSLRSLARLSRMGVVVRRMERTVASLAADEFAIRSPSLETPVDSLSGGNQQKVLLAGAIATEPDLLVLDEPTLGVDVGARTSIYSALRKFVSNGRAVVLHSSDAGELAGICDRVMVLSRGRVVREFAGEDVTEGKITECALRAEVESGDARVVKRNCRKFRHAFAGDIFPSVLLAVIVVGLGAYTASVSGQYLTDFTFSNLLGVFATLAFFGCAQQFVMVTGAFDLSVGPLAGLLLVVASFFLSGNVNVYGVALGLGLMFVIGGLTGATNWGIARLLGLSSIVVTLVTYMALQGVSLVLRPQPEGYISTRVTAVVAAHIGFMPVAAGVAFGMCIALEVMLRRTHWGIKLRGVGSSPEAARSRGIRVPAVRLFANIACSLMVVFAAVMLLGQVGVGDPSAGVNYTLPSITVIVLGGASVLGGRGSFIGAALGALLLQQIDTVVTFLRLGSEWPLYLLGLLTIVAASVYSGARARGLQW